MDKLIKVAVTGATGFIGTRLVDALVKKGYIVHPIGREYRSLECDIVYHLACPATTAAINDNPIAVMDVIMDKTRQALQICPTALFVNASSMGANFLDLSSQGAYNVAKRCMESYIHHSGVMYKNYRIPSVYGPGMDPDGFIRRCIDGTAYYPPDPLKLHYIAHIDKVVDALIDLREIDVEEITLGEIYQQFGSGSRSLHD